MGAGSLKGSRKYAAENGSGIEETKAALAGSAPSAPAPRSRVSTPIPDEAGETRVSGYSGHSGGPRRSARQSHRIMPVASENDSPRSHKSERSRSSTAAPDPRACKFLAEVMKKHFVFGGLQDSDYDEVVKCMRRVKIGAGEDVFQQGDTGDSCYFIQSGIFSVRIEQREVKNLEAGHSFGELALLYQMTRSATITCVKGGELWQMDHVSFRECLKKMGSTQTRRALTFFRLDPNFRLLPAQDQRLLADLCSLQHFSDGEVILREGEVGEWMLIVVSGKVVSTDKAARPFGAVLGSVGLIYGKKQVTGFKAQGAVTCLALGKGAFPQLSQRVEAVLRRCAVRTLLLSLEPPRGPHNLGAVFGNLADKQLHRLIANIEDCTFEPNEVILWPNDPAQLIIVVDGDVAILKEIDSYIERADKVFCEQQVETLRAMAERVLHDGWAHGEQPELFNGEKMSYFAVALCRVRLHRVTHVSVKASFGQPLCEIARQSQIKRVLSDIFLFKNLREDQIERTVRRMTLQTFNGGTVVVQEGDAAKHFFLIQSGTINVRKGDLSLRTLGRWDYFGERGLLLDEKRSATCEALEECVCLVLDDDSFFEIVGMFRKELERRMHLQDLNIQMSDLAVTAVVGRGSFGVVRLVHPKSKQNTQYALKCVKKLSVVKHRQEKSIVMEREVNAQCYHPCIVQFIKTFQDSKNVYFLTEFLGGGDLFSAIREIGSLTKGQAQFFTGCIALAIEYVHARGVMYRDLKPENVLLSFDGYAKLVDFGCCTKERQAFTLIGTAEYMAPEVILGKGYVGSVDWWSMGVMMYEFIVGPLPFGADSDDQNSTFQAILKDPLAFPSYMTDDTASSIISGLLERQPDRRMGASGNATEMKAHPYFEDFDWDALAGGFFKPPWKPPIESMMAQWEPPDGDLMAHVSKDAINFSRGMEWAKVF